MEWNVYYFNINARKFMPYNVLARREEDIKKIRKEAAGDKQTFDSLLRREMMYHYWRRAEWEFVMQPWCGGGSEDAVKIDVFEQLKLNWDKFVDYCWSYKRKKNDAN